jgi:hypothetical protein
MIRCIRLWSGLDGHSLFEEGIIDLEPGQRGDTNPIRAFLQNEPLQFIDFHADRRGYQPITLRPCFSRIWSAMLVFHSRTSISGALVR